MSLIQNDEDLVKWNTHSFTACKSKLLQLFNRLWEGIVRLKKFLYY